MRRGGHAQSELSRQRDSLPHRRPGGGAGKTLEREACQRSQSHSEIFGRLNALERGMATVTTQYDSIAQRLSCISADINAIKDQPSRRWETVLAAAITGVVGYLLARLGLG